MKVPPQGGQPPPKPPKGGRPKGLTRRTVKGAAGGMLGVDYEDARRPDPFLKADDDSVAEDGQDIRRRINQEGEGEADRLIAFHRADSSKDNRPDRSAFADQGQDRDAGDQVAHTKQKKRIKKLRHSHESDEDQKENQPDEPIEIFEDGVDEFDPSIMIALQDRRRSEYFQEQEQTSPGDLNLVDPDEIHRVLATPIAYAKHIMILAEAFRRSTGANRAEAIKYMANMFLGPSDRHFGWAALKEFGHATGIIDIYPLEIIEHIIENHPGCLPKVSFGRLFVPVEQSHEDLESDTETPLVFTYPENLKIRGFALKGGGHHGYLFQPGERPGLYELNIKSPGRFQVLVSALNRSGYSVIDRFSVKIHATKSFVPREERSGEYPARDAERVAQWPMPDIQDLSPLTSSDEEDDAPAGRPKLMSAADLIHFTTMSAMQGPKTRGGHEDEEEPTDSTAKAAHTKNPPSTSLEIHTPLAPPSKDEHAPGISADYGSTSHLDVPTPWSQESDSSDGRVEAQEQEELGSGLSEGDKEKLLNAVQAVLKENKSKQIEKPKSDQPPKFEEPTQKIAVSDPSVEKEKVPELSVVKSLAAPDEHLDESSSTIETSDAPQAVEYASSERPTIPLDDPDPEEKELVTGEETQPLKRSELQWILNNADDDEETSPKQEPETEDPVE